MRPSFLKLSQPYLAAIVVEATPNACMANIRNAEHEGAQGFMLDMATLPPEHRTPAILEQIIKSTGRPVMPLVYRAGHMPAGIFTEEQRAGEMFKALDAGAAGCDVMGDLYDPSPRELTRNPDAVQKQKKLIEKIHAMGGEVLMSSHMPVSLTAEETLEHMQRMQERGVDIAKIVVTADTEEEFIESQRATVLLKRKLTVPFVHLCNGKFGRLQRFVAPLLGASLTFGIREYNELSLGIQPTVRSARTVLNELTWHMD
ncbi:MAG: type I 3-dehydroquinate dehydratase [Spirochaetes bacterium]|nr:type I 3-dehydroquinate dehydratase [Spirochaetota bacterium]